MKFKKVLKNDIVISSSHNNGFIVKIGCCTLAYGCADDLLRDLKDYLENPESIEKEYNKYIRSIDVVAQVTEVTRDIQESFHDKQI